MNALNIVSILLNNNVNPIRFGLSFHIFFMISLYTTNGSHEEVRSRIMIDSISKFPFTWQFFFRAFFLFAILKGRNVELRTAVVIFVLLMLLPQLLSLMWLPLQPPSLSLSLLLFLPLLAAVDAFGFISSEWNWFFSKAYRINGKYMYKEQIGDYFDFFSLISFCFFFFWPLSVTLHNNGNNRKPIFIFVNVKL